jgi:hypothetical protein
MWIRIKMKEKKGYRLKAAGVMKIKKRAKVAHPLGEKPV